MCSENNYEFAKTKYIKDLIKGKNFYLILENLILFLSIELQQNATLENFWELLQKCKKVIVFQTDSLLCEKSNFVIDDFESFLTILVLLGILKDRLD